MIQIADWTSDSGCAFMAFMLLIRLLDSIWSISVAAQHQHRWWCISSAWQSQRSMAYSLTAVVYRPVVICNNCYASMFEHHRQPKISKFRLMKACTESIIQKLVNTNFCGETETSRALPRFGVCCLFNYWLGCWLFGTIFRMNSCGKICFERGLSRRWKQTWATQWEIYWRVELTL